MLIRYNRTATETGIDYMTNCNAYGYLVRFFFTITVSSNILYKPITLYLKKLQTFTYLHLSGRIGLLSKIEMFGKNKKDLLQGKKLKQCTMSVLRKGLELFGFVRGLILKSYFLFLISYVKVVIPNFLNGRENYIIVLIIIHNTKQNHRTLIKIGPSKLINQV